MTRGYYELTTLPFPEFASAEETVDRSEIPAATDVSGVTFPEIKTTTLSNGMQLVVANSGTLPLVDVAIRIETGNSADERNSQGISDAVFVLMDKGTKKFDANELAAEKDAIAMGARLSAGVDQSSFSYQILSNYLGESLEIAAEILRNPTFPEEELDKFRQRVFAYLSNIEQNPATNARAMFNRAIYGHDHVLGGVWTSALVENLNHESLKKFHAREIAPDNIKVFMIGDVDLQTASELMEDSFGNWRGANQSTLAAVGDALTPKPKVILVHQPQAVQSSIVVGHAIAPFDAATNTELTVLNEVFGGDFERIIDMLTASLAFSRIFSSGPVFRYSCKTLSITAMTSCGSTPGCTFIVSAYSPLITRL